MKSLLGSRAKLRVPLYLHRMFTITTTAVNWLCRIAVGTVNVDAVTFVALFVAAVARRFASPAAVPSPAPGAGGDGLTQQNASKLV
ncbi:hypothetical protein niasHT_011552 [Heterodera trifolii]|uniref:Uncharacterized protein n=1 Tax=Heterodera trifolii TaxID=157864 RepID=A0ABD2LGL6_9BILA